MSLTSPRCGCKSTLWSAHTMSPESSAPIVEPFSETETPCWPTGSPSQWHERHSKSAFLKNSSTREISNLSPSPPQPHLFSSPAPANTHSSSASGFCPPALLVQKVKGLIISNLKKKIYAFIPKIEGKTPSQSPYRHINQDD